MAKPLSSELIAEVIPAPRAGARPTSVEEIQQQVAERFGISRAELVGSSRAATPLRARQVAIFLTRELTDLSLPQIGRLYGGRDHSTVLNSPAAGRSEPRRGRRRSPSGSHELRAAIHNPTAGEAPDGRRHCKNPAFPQASPQARNRRRTRRYPP